MVDGDAERVRRWRLMLGGVADGTEAALSREDARLDSALGFLYDQGADPDEKERNRMNVGMGASRPNVARWLGDIRSFFPSSVVKLMQQDAFDRLGMKRMLLEPEMLAAV